MKIPNIFVPEKDLNDKVNDLAKEQPVKPEADGTSYEPKVYQITDTTYLEIIQKKAEQIAIKLGRKTMRGSVFKDKETKLMIKYRTSLLPIPFGPPVYPVLTIYLKKGLFRKEKLFECVEFGNSGTVIERSAYKPDDGWVGYLENLYLKAKQK